ncbi:MAG TPA: alpha/beta fold hydrolase [Stellaceae bacterium]|nr:alpha/beta fold hydrolase [Stellaceae bacterium]
MTSDPATVVADVESRAEIRRTPCGTGSMVWHIWGQGAPVALLHGGYGSWTHWIRNVEPLGERYRVLVPDLPGLGDSGLPPEPDRPEEIAEIVTSGLQSLMRDGETADIAGFSFGGLIGGLVAEQMGAGARSLVLVGSGGLGIRRGAPIDLVTWRDLPDEAARRAAHLENLAILMIADRAHIDDLAVHLQVGNATRARLRSRALSRVPALPTAIPRMSARLHGIWGERDITAQGVLHQIRRLLQSLQPGAGFAVIPRAGHWVQYEAAEEFNDCIIQLLGSRI